VGGDIIRSRADEKPTAAARAKFTLLRRARGAKMRRGKRNRAGRRRDLSRRFHIYRRLAPAAFDLRLRRPPKMSREPGDTTVNTAAQTGPRAAARHPALVFLRG
jgi:hypothetical protein